jgi:glyoxylase-like metal-dependent hydrolase (beta-lactamase superfamily II)
MTHGNTIERVEGEQMLVNSYLVHGPEGLVVVDGLTISDARKVRALIDAAGRPLAGVLVTHPHPDDTLWTLDDHTIFIGDVAYNDMHAYLFDGEHQAWLASLDELRRDLPDDAVPCWRACVS